MLKHLLVIWLVVSTLGYGSVWAFEGHLNEAAEHQGVDGGVRHAADEDGDHPSCDHCCHASAHLLALWSSQTDTTHLGNGTGATPYRHTPRFLATAPPERPPQS